MNRRKWRGLMCVFILGCAAAAIMLWVTRSGIGLSPDSRWYIELARAIRATGQPLKLAPDGTTNVQSHYPPGYPFVVAVAMWVVPAVHAAARYVNALAIVLSALLMFAAVHYATKRVTRGVLASALLLIAGGTWQTQLHLWSEPTFQVCMLGSLVCCGVFLDRGRVRWLVIAALLAGYGVTVRYAGVAFVGASMVALLLAPRPLVRWRRRLIDVVLFGVISGLPVIAWVLWYSSRTERAARHISFLWIDREKWNDGLGTFGEWFAYGRFGENTLVVLGAVGLAFALWIAHASWLAIRRDAVPGEPATPGSTPESERPAMVMLALPLVYLIVYPFFLITSVTAFDGATPLDRRILYPEHVVAILLLAAVVPLNAIAWRGFVGCLIVAQAASTANYLRTVREFYLGYNSMSWQSSSLIRETRALPDDAVIATNNAIALNLATDRDVFQLARFDRETFDEGDRQREINRLKDRLVDGAYLVMLNSRSKTKAQLSIEDLSDAFHLQLVHEGETGTIYRVDRSSTGDAIAATRVSDPTTRATTTRTSRKRR